MKRLAIVLLVPLLAAACGSSPASPSAAIAQAPIAVGLSLSFFSAGGTAQGGLGSPLTVTVSAGAVGAVSPGTIEAAVFKVVDAMGEIIAEVSVSTSLPIPPRVGGSSQTASVTQTLTWPIEKGYGKRIDVTLTIRDSSGATQTLSFWAPR
jgi:hypothetical protein